MTTLFSVHGTSGSLGECGPACYDAKEERCSCVCGGANHAIGQAGALRWTTENAEHLRAKYEGLGYKVNLHVQLGLPLAAAPTVHTSRGTENQEGAKMAEETKTAPCIKVWRFHDAPKEYRDLSCHGGDEDWLALVPAALADEHIPWLWPGRGFGACDVSEYTLPDGSKVYVGAHL